MDDLISRRKAFEYFVTLWECIGTIMDRDEWEDVCMTTAKEIPSAQPERKTGKWISTDDGWDGEYFVCSVCGCPWTLIEGSPEDNGMNFCPNCGADMKGAKQDETD